MCMYTLWIYYVHMYMYKYIYIYTYIYIYREREREEPWGATLISNFKTLWLHQRSRTGYGKLIRRTKGYEQVTRMFVTRLHWEHSNHCMVWIPYCGSPFYGQWYVRGEALWQYLKGYVPIKLGTHPLRWCQFEDCSWQAVNTLSCPALGNKVFQQMPLC